MQTVIYPPLYRRYSSEPVAHALEPDDLLDEYVGEVQAPTNFRLGLVGIKFPDRPVMQFVALLTSFKNCLFKPPSKLSLI